MLELIFVVVINASSALPMRDCNEQERDRCELSCQAQAKADEIASVKQCKVTGFLGLSGMPRESWLECSCEATKVRPQDVAR